MALRETTRVAVFFKRCNRARATPAAALADLCALGRGVADMVTFSESRWCGIHLTVELVRRCLAALQAVINEHQKSATGFDVPPAVAACIVDPAFGQGLAAASPFLSQMCDCTRILEANAAPLSSFVAAFVLLWLLLDSGRVAGIPAVSRSYLRDRPSPRFKRTVDCHIALAFYLDPFWAPMWGRAGSVSLGGKTMVEWRDQLLDEMTGATDGTLRAELSRKMQSFMRAHRPMMVPKADECLHPVGYWHLHGSAYPGLQLIAVRLLAACPTSAGGERCFKRVSAVMSKNRSTVSVAKANKHAQMIYNGGKLEHSGAIVSFVRTKQEKNMRREMAVGVPQPGAGGAHVGQDLNVYFLDAEGAGEDDPLLPELEAGEVGTVVDALFAVVPLDTDYEL